MKQFDLTFGDLLGFGPDDFQPSLRERFKPVCCLSDYSTAGFPIYFRADAAGIPALLTPVE